MPFANPGISMHMFEQMNEWGRNFMTAKLFELNDI